MLPCTSDFKTSLNLIQAASNKFPSSSQLYKETDKMWTWWGGDSSVVQWIVVGFQLQWGRFSAAGTYSFPIAFSTFYGIANAGITRTYDDYAYQFKDITTTQFYG